MNKLHKVKILDIAVTSEDEAKILEYILSSLKQERGKYYIVTPNPEIVVYASDHPEYKKIINEAEIALPDGVGVFIAAGLTGNVIKQRVTGVDFMEALCKVSMNQPITVGFLGGRDEVAELTADCLKKKYPWINIGFIGEEWSEEAFKINKSHKVLKSSSQITHRLSDFRPEDLKTSKPIIDILFVAFGHPKQEEWIYNNLDKIPVKIAMGVGGAFDYVSGHKKRAPFMLRAMGFEWLYRLYKEPWRWRRQLALLKFIWLFIKSLFKHSK